MLIMLGNRYCKDCIQAEERLKASGKPYAFHDFCDNMDYMREFLQCRDGHPEVFAPIIAQGGIGIPCFLLEDGSVTHDLEQALKD